jgi:hypothetical protein
MRSTSTNWDDKFNLPVVLYVTEVKLRLLRLKKVYNRDAGFRKMFPVSCLGLKANFSRGVYSGRKKKFLLPIFMF